ncbi:MAG: hypothetical protein KF746_01575 [Chitinophagaceae bacterium]|nr:hypothetical protein [Chitinophagaceae bacterium]
MAYFDEHISRVNDKLQLLLKQFQALQKENEKLKLELNQKNELEKQMLQKTELLQQQVEIARASVGESGKEVKSELEKRINMYVREIDRCIALLANQ